MTELRAADIRFRVDPADVPPEKAARRLHLTLERFNELLPRLRGRGFPPPDPDTGMYSLEAIDLWRQDRDKVKKSLTGAPDVQQRSAGGQMTMGERFAAKKRGGHG